MTTQTDSAVLRLLNRHEGITHAVSGLVVASAVLAVAGQSGPDEPLRDCVTVVAGVLVYALAHAYAAWAQLALGDEPMGGAAVRELAIGVLTTLLPLPVLLAPVLLAATSLWSVATGLWVSYGLAVAALAAVGLLTGLRREHSAARTALLVALSVVLGCLVIAFKQLAH